MEPAHAEGVGRHGPRATSRWPSSRPRRAARASGRSSSTRRRPTKATCTRSCTTPTPEQKEKYLRPLAEGRSRSCFAMTEPEVAGSDPTGIQTTRREGRRRLGDQRPQVVHLRREGRALRDPHRPHRPGRRPAAGAQLRLPRRPAQPTAGRSCATSTRWPAWATTARSRSRTCACPTQRMLGERGHGHLLGQYRLGPARLAHCMRWIGNAEVALEMLVDRALNREPHGSLLADKQAIQWMMAESAMELYAAQADGAARRVPDRERPAVQAGGRRSRSTTSPTRSGASSTARSRCTARSATRPTRRSSA